MWLPFLWNVKLVTISILVLWDQGKYSEKSENFICLDPFFLNSVLLFGPYLELYQSFYWLLCWKLKLQYPFSGFDYQFIQGHWKAFSIGNCTVWPILSFWMFSLLLKEPTFIFHLFFNLNIKLYCKYPIFLDTNKIHVSAIILKFL